MTSPLDDLIADLRRHDKDCVALSNDYDRSDNHTEAARRRGKAEGYRNSAQDLERLRPLIDAARRVAETDRKWLAASIVDAAAIVDERYEALERLRDFFPAESP